ncbi:hypothetical protein [Kitasatospora purpeofusca]|uniref:Uncharacterized protein n=1 Tax=Kitasatospora purpeofusca TaxID=67352 RepID=A0ABZ1TUP6_9ACTN|nr:hypothetical protein [Kitasatospora purpeofusca]
MGFRSKAPRDDSSQAAAPSGPGYRVTCTDSFCYAPTRIRSDRGVLIKLAVYNYDTGAYMYTNAH